MGWGLFPVGSLEVASPFNSTDRGSLGQLVRVLGTLLGMCPHWGMWSLPSCFCMLSPFAVCLGCVVPWLTTPLGTGKRYFPAHQCCMTTPCSSSSYDDWHLSLMANNKISEWEQAQSSTPL